MYAPQVTQEQVNHFTTDAESDPNLLGQAISRYGVIGHAQTSATARRNGKPLILRRDFDTTDGGEAGLHFVALQRSIEDFVTTRTAMNASSAQLRNPSITDTVNNGINEFIFVTKRGNYLLPTRAERSFPLLPGRAARSSSSDRVPLRHRRRRWGLDATRTSAHDRPKGHDGLPPHCTRGSGVRIGSLRSERDHACTEPDPVARRHRALRRGPSRQPRRRGRLAPRGRAAARPTPTRT